MTRKTLLKEILERPPDREPAERERPRLSGRLAALVLGILTILLGGGFLLLRPRAPAIAEQGAVFAVRRGDMNITVVENGEIRSKDDVKIYPETKSSYKIKYIVPEGTAVTEGDMLIDLDRSGLEIQMQEQEQRVLEYETSVSTTEENLKVQLIQNESSMKDADLKSQFARMDLERYLGKKVSEEELARLAGATETELASLDLIGLLNRSEGQDLTGATTTASDPGPSPAGTSPLECFSVSGEAMQQIRDARLKVHKAGRDLERAQEKLAKKQKLVGLDFATKADEEDAAFAVEEAKTNLTSCELSAALVSQYTVVKELMRRVSEVEQAKRAAERASSVARSQESQKQVEVAGARSRLESGRRRLSELKEEFTKTTIKAPRAGLVIIGEQGRSRWSNPEDIKVGREASPGRVLITLPDFSILQVALNVNEVDIDRIKEGQPVNVTVDAYPDLRLKGKVTKIANLAQSVDWYARDVKVFGVEVTLERSDGRLRPGMSAKSEIVVEQLKDAVYVPVHAVHEREGQRFCYVLNRGKFTRRNVTTGMRSDSLVQIKEGLSEGETIALYEPTEVVGGEAARGLAHAPEGSRGKSARRGASDRKDRDSAADSLSLAG